MRSVGFSAGAIALAVLVSVAGPAPAAAAWRCGARLVEEGQTIDSVYALCGEPADRTATTDLVTVHLANGVDVTRAVPIESWTYDRGPQQFVRHLTFRDGTLVEIDEGGYGY